MPFVIGAAILAGIGGFALGSEAGKVAKWVVIGGVAYLIYRKVK